MNYLAIIGILGTCFSTSAIAKIPCHMRLLGDRPDSKHYEMMLTAPITVESMIKNIIDDRCGDQDIIYGDLYCRNLIPHQDHTNVCAMETSVGYFIISKDFMDKYHIVYNRWD